jgi:hypothetical protein
MAFLEWRRLNGAGFALVVVAADESAMSKVEQVVLGAQGQFGCRTNRSVSGNSHNLENATLRM